MTGFLFRKTLAGLAAVALLLGIADRSVAEGLKLKVVAKEPPTELDASVRSTLQPKAVQLLDGDNPVLEFWFRTEVPLKARPASAAKALDSLSQATLLGAVAVRSTRRDYKDGELATGVHTMRFALQPQDGNHLGTSDHPFFLVLVPAKIDTKLDGLPDYKSLVKASSKETSTGHPVILSLRPADTAPGDLPALNEPAPEHKGIRLKLPAKASGSAEKTDLVFDLVFEGKGHL